jgi:hypothetical protein
VVIGVGVMALYLGVVDMVFQMIIRRVLS